MRKLSVEICPITGFEFISKKIIKKIESIKMLELKKLDLDRGIIAGIFEIKMKDDNIIDNLHFPKEIKIFTILEEHGNDYICFLKIQYNKIYIRNKLKDLDFDIIWTRFELEPNKKLQLSVIGENEQLIRFLEVIKNYGELKIISFQKAAFENHNILSSLTNKQRETLLVAKKNGYYDYPRAINGFQLSKKMGISKATTIEHLRKAERRLISQILVGY
ncbi:MAG: helix-turn-helix domain-containing protein [Thermoplasmatales archaeon]|nr:MAG: helix-turn-helix domain-containing protein [Thermoplasmatales archaeon]